MIYFDNAATTFPKPPNVVEAVNSCMIQGCVNAGRGVYPMAREADSIILQTRAKVLKALGFNHGHTIFSPSATLALNQILLGLKWASGETVYITPLEHNAVARVIHSIARNYNVKVEELPLAKESLEFDLEETEKMFFNISPSVVVMTHVSNVCGLITPIEEIAKLAKSYEAVVIVDGAQGGPLLPVKDGENIDFYVFSGHKTFYGPFGIAGFIDRGKVELNPLFFGGTGSHSEQLDMPEEQPFKFEVGSPNIVAITGIDAACDWLAETEVKKIVAHERELLAYAVEGLSQFQEVKMYKSNDLMNHLGTLSFNIDGYTTLELGMILSQNFDIATRTGLHCAPMAHKFLGTLPHGTVRLGFGYFNSRDEVGKLINAVEQITDEL